MWVTFIASSIVIASRDSDEKPADVAVVLGAAVWNGRPSPVFRERINHAINLYREKRVSKLFFTGGFGKGDTLSEAEVGANYAIGMGVDPRHVDFENTSSVTVENLRSFRSVNGRQGRVLLVSDPLHMYRAMTIAHDLGLDAHPSPTPTTRYTSFGSQAGFLWRETWLLTWYLLVGKFWALVFVFVSTFLALRWLKKPPPLSRASPDEGGGRGRETLPPRPGIEAESGAQP